MGEQGPRRRARGYAHGRNRRGPELTPEEHGTSHVGNRITPRDTEARRCSKSQQNCLLSTYYVPNTFPEAGQSAAGKDTKVLADGHVQGTRKIRAAVGELENTGKGQTSVQGK